MTIIGVATGLALAAIAFLHLMWAIGVWWPVRDEPALARTVAGFKGIDRMPPRPASLAVALAIAGLALLAIVLARIVPPALPDPALVFGGGVASSVFLLRGAAGYTAHWAALTPEQPFRRLDRLYFSPLCLALGVSFVLLTWSYVA